MVGCDRVVAMEMEGSGWIPDMFWRKRKSELFRIGYRCEKKLAISNDSQALGCRI